MTKGKTKQEQRRAKAAAKEATKDELTTHRITDTKTELKKQPFVIRSIALTEANEQTLENLKPSASDMLGQTVSSSALIRACLCFLAQQPADWIAEQLHPSIQAEIGAGRLWGTTRKTGRT